LRPARKKNTWMQVCSAWRWAAMTSASPSALRLMSWQVDVLARLDVRQRPDAVAVDRRGLEIEPLGGAFHARRQALLDLVGAAG
jgi:hypothetical protein